MAKPVEALRAVRGLLAEGGVALVADEVADEFGARRRRRARDVRLVDPPLPPCRAGRAAVGRDRDGSARVNLSALAEAGFGKVEVVPIEHDFWRFYRLEA